MLMTKFTYLVEQKENGGEITVTRLQDGAIKVFFQANLKSPEAIASMRSFMDSITDELAEGYFPKPRKDKK